MEKQGRKGGRRKRKIDKETESVSEEGGGEKKRKIEGEEKSKFHVLDS